MESAGLAANPPGRRHASTAAAYIPIIDADYVVVGAGSAGCVLANRLSADPGTKVVLLEAGGTDAYPWIHIPIGYLYTMNNPRTDWCFKTTPQPGLGGRVINYARGKGLGGCSSINGMIYQRGAASDYNRWGESNPGWAWDEVGPTFARCMDYDFGASDQGSHQYGSGGEWHVEAQRCSFSLLDEFGKAAEECGIPLNPHFNNANNEGYGYFQVNQRKGVRLSVYRAFLKDIEASRPNLTIITQAQTRRLLLEGNTAVGVEFAQGHGDDAPLRHVLADKSVVVSAGAIGSPHLLQVSGIGDPAMLSAAGVATEVELPGVGANLHDHLQIRTVFKLKSDTGHKTVNEMYHSLLGKIGMGLEYIANQSGPMSMGPSQMGLFAKSSDDVETPDLQYHLQPLSLDAFGEPLHKFPGFTASVCNLRPTSRGAVTLQSPDVRDVPLIDPAFLESDNDRDIAAKSIRHARMLASAPSFRDLVESEYLPGAELSTDAELAAAAGRISTTIFHPVGTCKMGPDTDPMAVVDERLRVRGIEGLRVVDASIMPSIVSGNTSSPTVMIAEKASQYILDDVESERRGEHVKTDDESERSEVELESMYAAGRVAL